MAEIKGFLSACHDSTGIRHKMHSVHVRSDRRASLICSGRRSIFALPTDIDGWRPAELEEYPLTERGANAVAAAALIARITGRRTHSCWCRLSVCITCHSADCVYVVHRINATLRNIMLQLSFTTSTDCNNSRIMFLWELMIVESRWRRHHLIVFVSANLLAASTCDFLMFFVLFEFRR